MNGFVEMKRLFLWAVKYRKDAKSRHPLMLALSSFKTNEFAFNGRNGSELPGCRRRSEGQE
jgi:hypothetical protein